MIIDKIYIDSDWLNFHIGDPVKDDDIAFIRKGALLELIKEEEQFWDDGKLIFSRLKEEISSL